MAVTSFDEILLATAAQELTIAGFAPNTEITVLVRKPNFYTMLAGGAVPNPLIPEMEKLFVHRDRSGHATPSEEFAKTLIFIAQQTLVEPSYEKLQENNIELSDDQLTEISLFATNGAENLRTFRAAIRNAAGKHGEAVQNAAQPDAANP